MAIPFYLCTGSVLFSYKWGVRKPENSKQSQKKFFLNYRYVYYTWVLDKSKDKGLLFKRKAASI